MPPKVTAGLARSRVSGYRRSPAPPASKTPSVSFIGFRFDAAFGPEEAPWSLSFRRLRTRDSVPEQLHSCRQGPALAQSTDRAASYLPLRREKIMNAQHHCVFVTGGTGYVGRALISQLLARGHDVRALVRPGSEKKLAVGCHAISGDALDGGSYVSKIPPADTFVQLVGVAHPSPAKVAEFRNIDLASGQSAIDAAKNGGVRHFVY